MPEITKIETEAELAKLDPATTTHLHVDALEFRVEKLKPFLHLTVLRFSPITFSGYEPIARLTRLEELDLVAAHADLSPLRALTRLKTLVLRGHVWITDNGSFVRDVSPLAAMTVLEVLHLDAHGVVASVAPLGKLTRLRTLTLVDCYRLTDISGISRMRELESLSLAACDSLVDLGPLAGLPRLRELDISKCGAITDIRPLLELPDLKSLVADECRGDLSWAALEDRGVTVKR